MQMPTVLHNFLRFIQNLDTRKRLISYGIFVGTLLVTISLILFMHYRAMNKLDSQIRSINKERKRALHILQQHYEVLEQQQAVQVILEQEPNFYINQYVMATLQQLGIGQQLTKDLERSEQDLAIGYKELRLVISLSGLSMQAITQLLYAFEQNKRIWLKELKMSKNVKTGLIDVTLVIATLEPSTR
jgi:hypothetical protein